MPFFGWGARGSDEYNVILWLFHEIRESYHYLFGQDFDPLHKVIEYEGKNCNYSINNDFVSYLDSLAFFIIALDVCPKARNQLLEKIIPTWQWLITALLGCKDLMGKNILISCFWLYYSFFFFQMVYKMNFLSCLQSVFRLCRKF